MISLSSITNFGMTALLLSGSASIAHATEYYAVVPIVGKSSQNPAVPPPQPEPDPVEPSQPVPDEPDLDISFTHNLKPVYYMSEGYTITNGIRPGIRVLGDPEYDKNKLLISSSSHLPGGVNITPDGALISGVPELGYASNGRALFDIEIVASYKGNHESFFTRFEVTPIGVRANGPYLYLTYGVAFETNLRPHVQTEAEDLATPLPVTFKVAPGSRMPPGLTLDSRGKLSGVPDEPTQLYRDSYFVDVFLGTESQPRATMRLQFQKAF